MTTFFEPLKPIVILFLSVVLSFSAIDATAQKLKVGIRGGVSFANFINHNAAGQSYTTQSSGPVIGPPSPSPSGPQQITSYNPNYSTSLFKDLKIGQTYTLYGDYVINNNWNLEIGLGYSQKGIDLNYSSTSRSENNSVTTVSKESVVKNFRLHYITLPTVFKLKLGAKQNFYLTGGTYTALLLKANVKEDVNTEDVITYNPQNNFPSQSKTVSHFDEGYSHRMDFGITAGAGFEIPINEKWFCGLDLRVNAGVVDLPTDYNKYHFFNFSATTKNINMESALKVSYLLHQ